MGKRERRTRLGHVGVVFEETGGLPSETGEPEEVIQGKTASGNTA